MDPRNPGANPTLGSGAPASSPVVNPATFPPGMQFAGPRTHPSAGPPAGFFGPPPPNIGNAPPPQSGPPMIRSSSGQAGPPPATGPYPLALGRATPPLNGPPLSSFPSSTPPGTAPAGVRPRAYPEGGMGPPAAASPYTAPPGATPPAMSPSPPGALQGAPLRSGPSQPPPPPLGPPSPGLAAPALQTPAALGALPTAPLPRPPPPTTATAPPPATGPHGGFAAPTHLITGFSEGGPAATGQKAGLDPRKLPSGSTLYQPGDEGDEQAVGEYGTLTGTVPPSSVSRFRAVDQGNASPRCMRPTLYTLPATAELLKACHLPMALLAQPLAAPAPGEDSVPLVDMGDAGPVRCSRCAGYMNPFNAFTDGGRQYVCALCGFVNETPQFYFSPLEHTGRRRDAAVRPELSRGSVEFVATKDFIVRELQPLAYVFAVDVSSLSVEQGLLHAFLGAARALLPRLPPHAKVGFITYDTTVHFYNLSPALKQPQMLVVSDVQGMFVPQRGEGLLVRYSEAQRVVDALLEALPGMFRSSPINESLFGAALQAAALALEGVGGRVLLFQSSLPVSGPGALKKRDDPKLLGSDKEKTLFAPQDPFYAEAAQACVKEGIAVNVFLAAQSYVDVATLGEACRYTGGELYYYPGFTVDRDGPVLRAELHAAVLRPHGSQAVMRLRTSTGLSVDKVLGHYVSRNSTDVELGGLDSDSTFAYVLKHDDKLSDRQLACVQLAVLYTTADGARRIRVHTLSLPVAGSMASLFRSADLDAIANVLARTAVLEDGGVKAQRRYLFDETVHILAGYRKYCASSNSPVSQLILPESLKLLPALVLGLLKAPLLRTGSELVRPDDRAYALFRLGRMPLRAFVHQLYPLFIALTPESLLKYGTPLPAHGYVRLPPPLPLSAACLSPNAMFLLAAGPHQMLLWVGNDLPREFLYDVLGVASLQSVDTSKLFLEPRNNEASAALHAIIQAIQNEFQSFATVRILKQADPHEQLLLSQLIEDKGPQNLPYVEFLCHLHREINKRLA